MPSPDSTARQAGETGVTAAPAAPREPGRDAGAPEAPGSPPGWWSELMSRGQPPFCDGLSPSRRWWRARVDAHPEPGASSPDSPLSPESSWSSDCPSD